jgi:hypothetical protein
LCLGRSTAHGTAHGTAGSAQTWITLAHFLIMTLYSIQGSASSGSTLETELDGKEINIEAKIHN